MKTRTAAGLWSPPRSIMLYSLTPAHRLIEPCPTRTKRCPRRNETGPNPASRWFVNEGAAALATSFGCSMGVPMVVMDIDVADERSPVVIGGCAAFGVGASGHGRHLDRQALVGVSGRAVGFVPCWSSLGLGAFFRAGFALCGVRVCGGAEAGCVPGGVVGEFEERDQVCRGVVVLEPFGQVPGRVGKSGVAVSCRAGSVVQASVTDRRPCRAHPRETFGAYCGAGDPGCRLRAGPGEVVVLDDPRSGLRLAASAGVRAGAG